MLKDLHTLFARDLDTLRAEVALYPSDVLPWQAVAGCPNPGGNLVLHIVGNLRHFIGAQLGATGYIRDRAAEFATTGFTRAKLQTAVSVASADVARTLLSLEPARLAEPYPLPTLGQSTVTGLFLLHLSTHLAFHLGQLDYHRRVVTGDRVGAGALSLAPLFNP